MKCIGCCHTGCCPHNTWKLACIPSSDDVDIAVAGATLAVATMALVTLAVATLAVATLAVATLASPDLVVPVAYMPCGPCVLGFGGCASRIYADKCFKRPGYTHTI